MTSDIDRIFHPDGADAFLRVALGRHALFLEGDPNRFCGVVSWEVLNHLAAFGGLSAPRLQIMQGDQDVDETTYLRRTERGYPRLLVRETNELLREGALLAIDGMELLHEPVAHFSAMIEAVVRASVTAELYACWREGEPRSPKWDDHETMLLQIEGSKFWRLFEPATDDPVAPASTAEPAAKPRWSGVMQTGDLLYIPRGWWYQDEAVAGPALYLALTFQNPRGADMMARLLVKAGEREVMRRDIPRFQTADLQSAFLTRAQEEIVALANAPGLVRDLLREMQEASDPRTSFHFPWSAAAMPLPPRDDCRLVPLLRFPSAFSMGWRVTTGHVVLPHNRAAVKIDWAAGTMLELICSPGGTTWGNLLDNFENTIPRDRALGYLSELIGLGLVATADPLEERGSQRI